MIFMGNNGIIKDKP